MNGQNIEKLVSEYHRETQGDRVELVVPRDGGLGAGDVI